MLKIVSLTKARGSNEQRNKDEHVKANTTGWLTVCLFGHLSACLPVRLPACLLARPPAGLSVCLSVCLSIKIHIFS